jgi:hypothetical protein
VDEARRALPAAASPEVERTFQTFDGVRRALDGDKNALNSIPPPQGDDDISGRFTIGWVNLAAGSPEVAATRFKEIVDSRVPGISTRSAVAPLFYGRALVKLGRTDEARKAYQQFFDNWNSADATLPILTSARLEYQTLLRP